jgi:hypothetical protein
MNSMYSNRRTFSSRVGFCGGVDVRTESKVGLRVEVVETELEGVKVVPVGEEVPVETELEGVKVVPVETELEGVSVVPVGEEVPVETELEGVKVVPVGEEVPVETELEVEVVPVGAGVTGATVEASFPVEF